MADANLIGKLNINKVLEKEEAWLLQDDHDEE